MVVCVMGRIFLGDKTTFALFRLKVYIAVLIFA
jgi:hypothetical protein